jgi:hypothetical protein
MKQVRAILAAILTTTGHILTETVETLRTVKAGICLLYRGWRVTRNWKAHKRNLDALQRATLKVKRGRVLGKRVKILTGEEDSETE